MLHYLYLLSTEDLTNKYWRIKNIPPLAEAFVTTNKCTYIIITTTNKFPVFDCEYDDIIFNPSIIFPTYTQSPHINTNIMKSILSNYNNEYVTYTDGSKNDHGTGCVYYVSNTTNSHKIKVNSLYSIFTAEGYAIQAALERIS